jgi:hypothetical protein
MASRVRRAVPWLCGVAVAGCAGLLAVHVASAGGVGLQIAADRAADLPTQSEAEALLNQAHGLAQAHDYEGLCQAIAQNPVACRQIVQWAAVAHAAPSPVSPSVESASIEPSTRTAQGAEVLHIRGIRADGSNYKSDFSAVRTATGQVRSQNAVYWFSTFAAPPR